MKVHLAEIDDLPDRVDPVGVPAILGLDPDGPSSVPTPDVPPE